jgi:hypothetical protein
MPMSEIRLSPRSVSLPLLAVFVALLSAHLAFAVLRIVYDRDSVFGLAHEFDFDREGNIPAWFDALLLAAASVLSFLAARFSAAADLRQVLHWLVIGIAFAFLSFDEIASIHELLKGLGSGRGMANLGGWAVLYVPVVVLLGLSFIPFLLRLPRRSALIIVASGLMFVSGAVAMEALGSKLVEDIAGVPITQVTPEQWLRVRTSWSYVLEHTVEESLEMCGLILYIHGVLDYFSRRNAAFAVGF